MEQNYLTRAAKYLADLRKRRLWKRIVSGLGTAVVFCTVYALILPAITMTIPTVCGQEEHTHDASCYAAGPVGLAAQVPVVQQMCSVESVYADVPDGRAPYVLHIHSEFCYRDGVLVCTLPEMPEHIHEDTCYTEVRQVICGQEETIPGGDPMQPGPTVPAHQHGESCYEDRLICGQEETAGHVHTDECYSLIPGLLTCVSTEEGHIHGESCYAPPQRQLVCGQEAAGHTHTDGCYSLIPGPLTCVSTEAGHIHSESCYAPPERQLVCGQEEAPAHTHTHTPACYQRQLVCTLTECQPDTAGDQSLYGSADLADGNVPLSEMLPQFMPAAHVHTDACYETVRELTCTSPAVPHEHDATCYNELGGLACGRQVLRSHVHNEGCFTQVDLPPAGQPEDTEKTPACGKPEHTHDETCYELQPAGPSQEQQNWDAIFWSNTVMDASDAVLDASVQGVWKDSNAMDQELLAALHNAAPADLTRFLDLATIQVDGSPYSVDSHGPMDAESPFAVALSWTLDEARLNSAGTMTYHYQFPEQIQVENIERRALSDAAVEGAVAYSVQNNLLSVTYRIPAESVSVRLVLRASWAPELGENTRIQWSNGAFTDVTFARPELAVTKTMGENGLRVEESGEVWADYTVTVSNTGAVAAKEITLTDTMESTYFHFARGGFEGGMDYSAAVQTGAAVPGAEEFLTFENYDGGNTLTFPAFDLAAGESRVFRYKARMSAEDRAGVDKAIKDGSAAGETVRNTARAVCAGCGEGAELTASSQGTYNGLESKHIEDYSQTYSGETFDVTFTVNGDAQLPAGMTAEKLEAAGGEGLTLDVKELEESDEAYQTFAQAVEPEAEGEAEETDSQLLIDLSVLGLELHYNGVALDLADCEVEATVTPNEALKNYREPLSKAYAIKDEDAEEDEEILGDKGFTIELKAFTLEEKTTTDVIVGEITTTEPVEEGSVSLDVSEDEEVVEQPAEIEPVTFAVENGVAAFSTSQVEYPTYTVDFYADLDRLDLQDTGGKKHVKLIDTSGAQLPKNNNTTPTLKYVAVPTEGDNKGVLATRKELTHIFNAKTISFNPYNNLDLGMFDVLEQLSQKENPTTTESNYKLSGIIITKQGQATPTLIKNDKWPANASENVYMWSGNPTVYPITGEASAYTINVIEKDDTPSVDGNTVNLPKYATITMVFEPTNGTRDQSASFYDYDISDGLIYTSEVDAQKRQNGQKTSSQTDEQNKIWYANILENGINSATNYNYDNRNLPKLAFGNNWPTNLAHEKLGGYAINEGSTAFNGCSFGIVSGYEDGHLVYNVRAPKLFDESGSVAGKTPYSGRQLEFKRQGDTYTMSAVKGTRTQNLDVLEYQRPNWNNTLQLYSNNFWPMDDIAGIGKDGHDFRFGLSSLTENRWFVGANGRIENGSPVNKDPAPRADHPEKEGMDHNAYFGMQFNLEFTVPKDYVGPLDYTFFGDDDLWLFLEYPDGTNRLVCDIGGVHSSVGEYVNLRDYIPNGESGTYKLHLFYTERGASGSTCWMQYTLPGIRSIPTDFVPVDDTGSLRIEKTVDGLTDSNKSIEFLFDLTLSSSGVVNDKLFEVAKEYDCTVFRADGSIYVEKIPVDGEKVTIRLKANESAYLEGLVPGMTYTIKEQDEANAYKTQIQRTTHSNESETPTEEDAFFGKEISGNISANTHIKVTYTNAFYYALPETGGPGTAGQLWYTYAALPMMAAAVVVYKRSRRKGGTRF